MGDGDQKFSSNLDWDSRYGDVEQYKKICAAAHRSTHNICCVCMQRPSEEMHHTSYGKHSQGINFFPACAACHLLVCHSSKNWIKDKKDPVKKSHNTPEFVKQLKQNYKQLTKGANYGKQNKS